jgi:hypothetical protein
MGKRASLLNGVDDDTKLPVYCRYPDLREAGIVGNWMQLQRMIDGEGFPSGVLLSRNIRAWPIDEVRQWLATRPSARKVSPYLKRESDGDVEKTAGGRPAT